MDNLLDLTSINTKRVFIVGGLNGEYDALMRVLWQQRFSYLDTLIVPGGFFNEEHPKSVEMTIFLRNSMNCFAVKGRNEVNFLKNIEDPLKLEVLTNRFGVNLNTLILDYIKELPLAIKYGDHLIVSCGLDPNRTLEEQDPEIFYSIGEYDKDSRFYQYDNPDKQSWYMFPYRIDGKRVKVCFSGFYVDEIEVPAGYNLGRDPEISPIFRCIVLDKTVGKPLIITFP